MLETFSCTLTKKEITEGLLKAWNDALKPYTWNQIREAGYRCLGELKYFPKPAELIERIKRDPQDPFGDSDFIIIDHGSCEECGASNVPCIKEPKDTGVWICRQCYTGLTGQEIAQRLRKFRKTIGEKDLNKEIGWIPQTEQKEKLKQQQSDIWQGKI